MARPVSLPGLERRDGVLLATGDEDAVAVTGSQISFDGKPALLNFQVQNGTYVVPKVLERGYLAIGKARFAFAQGR